MFDSLSVKYCMKERGRKRPVGCKSVQQITTASNGAQMCPCLEGGGGQGYFQNLRAVIFTALYNTEESERKKTAVARGKLK